MEVQRAVAAAEAVGGGEEVRRINILSRAAGNYASRTLQGIGFPQRGILKAQLRGEHRYWGAVNTAPKRGMSRITI